ncbi:MAG: type II secretion system F family protein [Gammaproteobacteria bacterium]|nr:type II secretion system F family protein [Gammaproteobacteria bacterium]
MLHRTFVRYTWQGIDSLGIRRSGEIPAPSRQLARLELSNRGLRRLRIKKLAQRPPPASLARPRAADITLFSRQLATMLKAGIPLVQAFDIVIEGLAQARIVTLAQALRAEVDAGHSLAQSLRQHPRAFDALYCSLVEAGEISGTLDCMLERLASFGEKSALLKAKLRKATNYPCAVLVVAIIVTCILLIKFVPTLATTFADYGAELPAFTRLVLALSDWVIVYWWLIPLVGALGLFVTQATLARSESARLIADRILLRLPVIGSIASASCHARFCRTLATTYAAGVPLLDALATVAPSTGNRHYAAATQEICHQVANGEALYAAIENTKAFPRMVHQMTRVGEESGTLEPMLERCAAFFENEVDVAVDNLTSLLEPAIIVIIGTLVGSLVIAMYLPIFELGSII